jgi:hypothetical protein
MTTKLRTLLLGAGLALQLQMSAAAADSQLTASSLPAVDVRRWQTNYHNWTNAWVLSNGQVEAVVVPSIGRIMQFRFAGDTDGPLWENHALDGKQPDSQSKEWGNFGGDKTWPAPQGDWGKVTPRAWPPPIAFDSMPVEVERAGRGLRLISPVDPHYGIRTRRLVTLVPNSPEMIVDTTYEKVNGAPIKVGIWTITQCKDPVTVFTAPGPAAPWPDGYNKQSGALPSNLKRDGPLLSLTRDSSEAHKIGTLSTNLLWVGEKEMLRISHRRIPNAQYPDQGSNAEVYTNPDPLQYVELEMLGPLHQLGVGDSIRETRTYTLFRRQQTDPAVEARALLLGR